MVNFHSIESLEEKGIELGDLGQKSVINSLVDKEAFNIIRDKILQLPENPRNVMLLYYFKDYTMKQIGKIIGLSESRVCQIHTKTIIEIKNSLKEYRSQ